MDDLIEQRAREAWERNKWRWNPDWKPECPFELDIFLAGYRAAMEEEGGVIDRAVAREAAQVDRWHKAYDAVVAERDEALEALRYLMDCLTGCDGPALANARRVLSARGTDEHFDDSVEDPTT